MLLRKLAIENVRSFLERQELDLDGQISIIIGPNGGGKTNLLDTAITVLRRYILAGRFLTEGSVNNEIVWMIQDNGNLSQLQLDRHSAAKLETPQRVEVELEVTPSDLASMRAIAADAETLKTGLKHRLQSDPWDVCKHWDLDQIQAGQRLTYIWNGANLEPANGQSANIYLEYLRLSELDNRVRGDQKLTAVQMPMMYLPVHRGSNAFTASVTLNGFDYNAQRQGADVTSSRSGASYVPMAVGEIAKKFRSLQEQSNVDARAAFLNDPQIKSLTADLRTLGYDWELKTTNFMSNSYDIELTKQGSSFLVSSASSGELELLTYLFAIHALNVRDALILIDEPELHLHPRWQASLLTLFRKLEKETGNQFVMATHSPTFVSPDSIQYVSRVYSEKQRSKIVRLKSNDLPADKHLFNVVNSQNNERIFFADCVLLVEGISDRIFFEKLIQLLGQDRLAKLNTTLEVVSVGGKGLFSQYQKLLDACKVRWLVIADLDYVEQVGTTEIKGLFTVNKIEIAKRIIADPGSTDGASLIDRIEEAMASSSWGDAIATWEYIKSRRVKLKPELSEHEQQALTDFIKSKRSEGVSILRKGALEAYLPDGYRRKDMEKLITLVNADDFLGQLPDEGLDEVKIIIDWILDSIAPIAAVAAKTTAVVGSDGAAAGNGKASPQNL